MIRSDHPTGLRSEIRHRTPCSDSYVRTDVRTYGDKNFCGEGHSYGSVVEAIFPPDVIHNLAWLKARGYDIASPYGNRCCQRSGWQATHE